MFDGLSSANLGNRLLTAMEIASQAEHSAQVEAETIVKKISKQKEIIPDPDEDTYERHQDLQGRETGDDSDENEDSEFSEDEENINKYKVRLNKITDMVELIDHKTGLIVETIAPDDLIGLISKTKGSSGILIDKEI